VGGWVDEIEALQQKAAETSRKDNDTKPREPLVEQAVRVQNDCEGAFLAHKETEA
jgi:hypothetical protein